MKFGKIEKVVKVKNPEELWKESYASLNRNLVNTIANVNRDVNVVCTALSLYMLLGQAVNAVKGPAQDEILSILSSNLPEDNPLGAMNYILKGINEHFNAAESGCKIVNSNAIFADEKVYEGLNEEFVETIKTVLNAELFKDGENLAGRINEWVKEKTDGMIDEIIDESKGGLSACLLNALAFDAEWMDEYSEDDIVENQPFRNSDGTDSEVVMLSSTEKEYFEDEWFKGFVKEYRGGKYALMVLLPKYRGRNNFREAMANLHLRDNFNNRVYATVDVMMPEFECNTCEDLVKFCKEQGLTGLFEDNVDFSPMTDVAVSVDSMIQKARIRVDRKGTRAAGASGMQMMRRWDPLIEEKHAVVLNRPFFFSIFDKELCIPMFTGIVNEIR